MCCRNAVKAAFPWLLVLPLLAVSSISAAVPGGSLPGVVVEVVERHGAAERAGMQPNDVVLAWSRAAAPPVQPESASGEIGSPFELAHVETEQGPRGPVTLTLERAGQRQDVSLGPGPWALHVRPRSTAEPRAAAWTLLRTARELADAQKWVEADRAFEQALAAAEGADVWAVAQTLFAAGVSHERRNAWAVAEDHYRRAVARYQEHAGTRLTIAACFHRMGFSAWRRGDGKAAEGFYVQAKDLWEKEAPESAPHGATLRELGVLARERGDLATAEKHGARALAVHEAVVPQSAEHALSLLAVATVDFTKGDLDAAEKRLLLARAAADASVPNGTELAGILNMLAGVAQARGDFALAEEHVRKALAIRERLAPESQDAASLLANLGVLAFRRGEWAASRGVFERALALFERIAPSSPRVAMALYALGAAELKMGELDPAQRHLEAARDRLEKLMPVSPPLAGTWYSLAELSLARGDLAAAEEHCRRALAMQEALGHSLAAAGARAALGDVAHRRGDLATARDLYDRALEVQQVLASGTLVEAISLHALGEIDRDSDRAPQAVDRLCRAVDALEQQRLRLGGTQEARSAFAAQYADYHHDCLVAQLAVGARDDAFHVLERSRARDLLRLLAERDALFAAELPEALVADADRIDRDYDRIQDALAGVSPVKDAKKVDDLLSRLRDLRGRREHLRSRIRTSAPRFAALRYPEPLRRADVQQVLDPGTVLLSYSVGRRKTVLFALTKTEMAVFDLPLGRGPLEEKVSRFRRLIERGRLGTESDKALQADAAQLFDALVRPAASLVDGSERVLICADGPLHVLPFGALVADGRYLVERKPLHMVVSATVYATVTGARREAQSWPVRLAAFGDPSYPALPKTGARQWADDATRSVAERGFRFEPLPASRREVERVKEHFSPKARRVYLGREATEERVKSLGSEAQYVHLACHAYLDRRLPLDSALVLTVAERLESGKDNGLLQAWEIFERVRLEADLVTLSACETGLGQDSGGEGLLGLTRAFQYAGAQSIVASLWRVADRSTAELMPRFYRYLEKGKRKDEALQAAQLDLIRGTLRHPFHWAAFQLTGDWK